MSIRLRMFLQGFSGAAGGYEIIHNEEYSARNFNSSPLTISDLKGDTFDYEFLIVTSGVSGDSLLDMTFNADTTANYRNYEMKGLSTTSNAASGDSDTAIELQNFFGTANPNFLKMQILGSSGNERYISSSYSADGAILEQSSYWKNTASQLTSITITAASSVTADAHVVLVRYPKSGTQGTWEEVSTLSWSAESSEKSFTSLLGDTDIQYRLVWSGDQELNIEINDDNGSNYSRQYLQNSSGSISSNNNTANTSIVTDGIESIVIINAESGIDRLCNLSGSNTSAAQQSNRGVWWRNTVDEVTSLDCTPSASATGTATLYKRVVPAETGDTILFEEIETVAVSGNFTAGHTFSSLTGDSEVLYKLEWLGHNASGASILRVQINGDTSTNYPEQRLRANFSTASAAAVNNAHFIICTPQNGDTSSGVTYIYPKSGDNRPILTKFANDEDQIDFRAGTWLNSVDEVTSIKVFSSNSNAQTGTLILSRMITS